MTGTYCSAALKREKGTAESERHDKMTFPVLRVRLIREHIVGAITSLIAYFHAAHHSPPYHNLNSPQ